MKALFFTFLSLCLLGQVACAALIANYDFDDYVSGSTGNDATITSSTDPLQGAYNDRVYDPATSLVLPAGINSVSAISFGVNDAVADQNKVETQDLSQRFRWRMHNATDYTGDRNPLEAVFTVDIGSGYELSNFSFALDLSGNAAGTFDLLYDAGSGFQTMTALQSDPTLNSSTYTFTSDTIATAVTGSVVFKIDVASGAVKTSRWDNIQVNGDIALVPEPSSSVLAMVGLVALALYRRRS